ncbi:HAMP domain-containing protein [Endozoicomonas sp. SM1973]|uniref:histidine kinase n=1 Tax=Spartinivicinus marinus TaxID=2994442 RepID=A0A853I014_9GAMM|nr:ATP-binding protein [Spartinivicinus marinus]MCX4025228.1 ATP-binding protein [Spartinivicinus marinus]NYZ65949.1 HAMP domain-containing protein [Spartinivicinus marinus]
MLSGFRTIKEKIILLAMGASCVALLLSTAILTYLEVKRIKSDTIKTVETQAKLISVNIIPALTFGEVTTANLILQTLESEPGILAVIIYRTDPLTSQTDIFSHYVRPGDSLPVINNHMNYLTLKEETQGIRFTRPIEFEGETLGYLFIQAEIRQLSDILIASSQASFVIALIALVIAFLIAIRFQRLITEPIQSLMEVTRNVTQRKDYTLRVPVVSNDELAQLAETFNSMMADIQVYLAEKKQAEQEMKQLNEELEQKVAARTYELETSNLELRSTLDQLNTSQQQLVEREKMASLGELVAGVAHEINTPIGIGVTSITFLQDAVKQLAKAYEQETLSAEMLEEFIENAKQSCQLLFSNLQRAADLVRSFKQVAVDQSSEQIRTFKVKEYLDEIILSLRPKLKRVKHEIVVDCDAELVITSHPGILSQIFTNLILNSLIHGFEDKEKGLIKIDVHRSDSHIKIQYQDNGKGLAKEQLNKLFEPFFTTKRGQGGSGLGTYIIYNLVTQGLGGLIKVDSQQGEGLTYEIEFSVD